MTNDNKQRDVFLQSQARHVRQCWKETKFVAVVWTLALIYCTTVFVRMGYIPPDQRPEVPEMVWGIPAWVFWGLFVPWIVLIGVTWFFAAVIVKEDEPYADLPKGDIDAAGRG